MPNASTVWDWMQIDDDLSQAVARARLIGHDRIAADALRIANTPVEGTITTVTDEGTTVRTEDALGHRKLQIETRLKLLACWDPKRYGPRQIVQGDPDAPPVVFNLVLTTSKGDG
jgi:hypothetical protein